MQCWQRGDGRRRGAISDEATDIGQRGMSKWSTHWYRSPGSVQMVHTLASVTRDPSKWSTHCYRSPGPVQVVYTLTSVTRTRPNGPHAGIGHSGPSKWSIHWHWSPGSVQMVHTLASATRAVQMVHTLTSVTQVYTNGPHTGIGLPGRPNGPHTGIGHPGLYKWSTHWHRSPGSFQMVQTLAQLAHKHN